MHRDEVRAELEALREAIPGLASHLVPPGAIDGLRLPDGFHLSRSLERLLRDGGPWIGGPPFGGFPGDLGRNYPIDRTADVGRTLRAVHRDAVDVPDEFGVRWIEIYFEQPVWILAAATREQYDTAPLLSLMAQESNVVLLFPNVEELVKAYELSVVTEPPDDPEYPSSKGYLLWLTQRVTRRPASQLLRQRLDELSATWHSEHPCWVPEWMPFGVAPDRRELPDRCVRRAPEEVLRAVFQMPDDYEIPEWA